MDSKLGSLKNKILIEIKENCSAGDQDYYYENGVYHEDPNLAYRFIEEIINKNFKEIPL